MNKTKLTLGEIKQLNDEINGHMNNETGKVIYEGFLNQKLSILLKYDLIELSEFLIKESTKVDKFKDELVLKFGTDNGKGGTFLSMWVEDLDDEGNVVSKKLNPKYIEFDEEMSKLMMVEKEFEYPDITKDDLKNIGETKDNYQVLFKLIKKGTN
jgi:hypothetical protein